MDKAQPIPTGHLWQRLCECSQSALSLGALHRIDNVERILNEGGIPFVLRIAKNLQRKNRVKCKEDVRGKNFNPFLPPEMELTVGAIGAHHLAVLNKFNVVEHHLLIVTRQFEPQEALLTPGDFSALCWSLREIDGLGFYNGGPVAGASQHHKHLQLIPLPLHKGQRGLPIEQVFPPQLSPHLARLNTLPFIHRIAALPAGLFDSPVNAATHCHQLYRDMLEVLHSPPHMQQGAAYQSAPYNLLLTRRWLMLVPRRQEHVEGISINAMGFAGSFFVKNIEEQKRLAAVGPLEVLCAASGDSKGEGDSG